MAGKDIQKLHKFLREAGTYYLATSDGEQPRVRPFGTALLFEDKIYILTSRKKNVSKQIDSNSMFEISAMNTSDKWIRVSGILKTDDRIEVHQAMLEAYPHMKDMYTADGENTHTLYLDKVKAVIYSFTEEPNVLDL